MHLIAKAGFLLALLVAPAAYAQELHEDVKGIWRAEVVEVVSEERRAVPGTGAEADVQTIRIRLLEGEREGEEIVFENDFIQLEEGDSFFLNYILTIEGDEIYSVREVDRRGLLGFFVLLFAGAVVAFGGKQGLRSLASLAGSFAVILYVLMPLLLRGYPPALTSTAIAAAVLFLAIYVTHGFNRESTAAFVGTVTAVGLTGGLAWAAVKVMRFTGFTSDESVYLNFATAGQLDFAGLLLGGIIIGVLGVLDDIAVTQSAVVAELFHVDPSLSRKEVYRRAVRVGREHVGALVNTLALAYAGASLPLLLYFSASPSDPLMIANQEIFAAEIVRTIVGSIGLILTVPITTGLAVWLLKGIKPSGRHVHFH